MKDTTHLNRYLKLLNREIAKEFSHLENSNLPCVTLSRMAGCRGNAIGQLLINHLNEKNPPQKWKMYGKDFGQKILEINNWPREYAPYLDGINSTPFKSAIEESLGLHPSMDMLHKKINSTIKDISQRGNVVILGRGANFILGRAPGTFHFRLVGTLPKRIQHIQESLNLNYEAAKNYLKRKDEEQSNYIQFWFKKDINQPLNYTAIINNDYLTNLEVVQLILSILPKTLRKAR